MVLNMVMPHMGASQTGRSQSVSTAVKAFAVGVCVASAMVLTTGQTAPSATELSEASALHTRGYAGSQNVFAHGYTKPNVGHWVTSDDNGHEKWMGGDAYVAAYGTDDPTAGKFLGHSKKEIAEAPSLVDEFGIDSNVFASDYKAPTNHDHIGVAMIHVDDDKKSDKKSAQKARLKSAQKAQMTLLSGGVSQHNNIFTQGYEKPKEGHWVDSGTGYGHKMWVNGAKFAAGDYATPSHKPRSNGPCDGNSPGAVCNPL